MLRLSTVRVKIYLVTLLVMALSAGVFTTLAQSRKKRSAPRSVKQSNSPRIGAREDRASKSKTTQSPKYLESRIEDVEGRENWFYWQRAYPFDSIPQDARRSAFDSASKIRRNELLPAQLLSQSWQPIGPVPTAGAFLNQWGLTGGRISAIAISPNNTQLILVGSPKGGIWRSVDGATNFSPVSDNISDISIGSIAIAPSNSQIVYAGAGEEGNRGYFGVGVLKSTNGGQSWARVSDNTLPTFGSIRQVAVDPSNPNIVYAVQHRVKDISTDAETEGGFYRSIDGGVTWTKTFSGLFRNMAIQPGNAQTLFLTATSVSPANAGTPAGIYRSTNGGQTWNLVYTAPFQATSDIRVAVTAANAQKVYAYQGGTNGGPRQLRVEVSNDGGTTWSNVGVRADIDGGQFNYNTYIVVSPTDASTIYIGSRDIFKSTNGGVSFTNIVGNFEAPTFQDFTPAAATTHPDQQTLAFAPNDSNTVYIGNDGGLFKSTNGGTTIQSLNNALSIIEFNGYAVDPTDPTRSYGGTQDNGALRRQVGSTQWLEVDGGDGGNFVVDPLTPSTVYSTYTYGSITRFTAFGATRDIEIGNNGIFGEPADGARILFYPPFNGNRVNSRLYFGSWKLFISNNNGTTWTAPGGTTDVTKGGTDTISAIGVARSNTNTIYVGSSEGNVQVSTNEGVAWTNVTAGLPNRNISDITVSATDPATAYVTVSGFGTGHIFKTTNTGAGWTDISGNLPNIPTNCLLVDPQNANTLYAGTDIGVFVSTAGGNTWATFNNGLPPVVVMKLVASNNGTIQAGTYGRGAYQLAVSNTALKLDAATYTANSSDLQATINVMRTGDTANAASVRLVTSDGTARQSRDYIITSRTINFAAGETTKPIRILLVDNLYPGSRTVNLELNSATGGLLDTPSSAILTINNNSPANPTTNPLDNADANFFVRQHYYDFLSRVPDPGGFTYWTGQITSCGMDQACIRSRKIIVSNAFFFELEYQQTAAYVFRLSRAAYGNTQPFPNPDASNPAVSGAQQTEALKLPSYAAFSKDRATLIGSANLAQDQQALANDFVTRSEFLTKYPANQTLSQFVDAIVANIQAADGADLSSQKTALLALGTRGAIIYRLANDDLAGGNGGINNRAFVDAEYNRSFVASQYFGYLRRNSDIGGFLFWLGKVDSAPLRSLTQQSAMVCSFTTSTEYQSRFSSVVTHSNAECPQ